MLFQTVSKVMSEEDVGDWVMLDSTHCAMHSCSAEAEPFVHIPMSPACILRHTLQVRPRVCTGLILGATMVGLCGEWATTWLWMRLQPWDLLLLLAGIPLALTAALAIVWSPLQAASFAVSFFWTVSTVSPGYAALLLLPSPTASGGGGGWEWTGLVVLVVEACETIGVALTEEVGGFFPAAQRVSLVLGHLRRLALQVMLTLIWMCAATQLHYLLWGHGGELRRPPPRSDVAVLHMIAVLCREGRRAAASHAAVYLRGVPALHCVALCSHATRIMVALRLQGQSAPPRAAVLLLSVLRAAMPLALLPVMTAALLAARFDRHDVSTLCWPLAMSASLPIICGSASRAMKSIPPLPEHARGSYLVHMLPPGWGLTLQHRIQLTRALRWGSALWTASALPQRTLKYAGATLHTCLRRKSAVAGVALTTRQLIHPPPTAHPS